MVPKFFWGRSRLTNRRESISVRKSLNCPDILQHFGLRSSTIFQERIRCRSASSTRCRSLRLWNFLSTSAILWSETLNKWNKKYSQKAFVSKNSRPLIKILISYRWRFLIWTIWMWFVYAVTNKTRQNLNCSNRILPILLTAFFLLSFFLTYFLSSFLTYFFSFLLSFLIYVCLSVCMSVCLYVCMSVCLSICYKHKFTRFQKIFFGRWF